MLNRMLVTIAALLVMLMPAAAQAGPLFPFQLGAFCTYDGSDTLGHTWQASIWVVAENVPLNGETYFQIRRSNWNPFGWERYYDQDLLIRSTDVAAFASVGGPEWLQFQTTGTPQIWTYPPGQTVNYNEAQVNGVQSVIVPYGGPYQAYVNQVIHHEGSSQSQPWYTYLVLDLGLIKEVQTDYPPGNSPMTQELSQIEARGVSLFPVTPRTRWTFNASDHQGHTWQMKMVIAGQMVKNNQTYLIFNQSNYDPHGGKFSSQFYARVTANQLFSLGPGDVERLEFQVGGPNTTWSIPDGGGTIYKKITSISPANAFEGWRSYLAYVTQDSSDSALPQAGSVFNYVVPGLGIAKIEDYGPADPERAPLTFTLASLDYAPVNNPGLMLLLWD